MLALPITAAQIGFWKSLGLFVAMWSLMAYVALLSLEINLYVGKGIAIGTAAKRFLGAWGNITASLSFLLLLYALLAAFTAGGGSILQELLDIPLSTQVLQCLFAGILGIFVFFHTKAVDYANRILFTAKITCLVLVLFSLNHFIDFKNLNADIPVRFDAFSLAIPIFFTAFGFHTCIHTIVDYVGPENVSRLKHIFVVGSLLPLVIYITWVFCCLGSLPATGDVSFANVFAENNDLGAFLGELNKLTTAPQLMILTSSFSLLALSTSFLGVGLGLFDYLATLFKMSSNAKGRLITTLLTLVLPIGISLIYPNGFITVLSYAAIMFSIFAVLIPACVVFKIRRIGHYAIDYRAPGGTVTLIGALLAGVVIILLAIYTNF